MSCTDYEALISAMLDGELSEEEERVLHTHLETCEACRNYLALLTALRGAPEADAPDPPADLTERIMASVKAAAPQKKKAMIWGIPTRSLALAAAAAVVILAGWSGSRLFRVKGAAPALQYSAAAPSYGETETAKGEYQRADAGLTAGNTVLGEIASADLFMDSLAEEPEEEAAYDGLPAEDAGAVNAEFHEFRYEDWGDPVPFTLWVGEEKRSSGSDCRVLEWCAAVSSVALPAPEREPDYTLRDDEGNILWSLWEGGDDTLMIRREDGTIFFKSAEVLWDALGVEP